MPGPSGGSQINSLIDLMPQQAAAPDTSMHFMGYPQGFAFTEGGGAMAGGPSNVSGVRGSAMDPISAARMAPFAPGAPWGMTRADLESPLAYMGGGPFVNPPAGQNEWTPRDTGGWFTLDQLYSLQPGGMAGGGGPGGARGPSGGSSYPQQQQTRGTPPGLFQLGSGAPSTNNWQLLGLGPGWIMRNGQPILVGQGARRGFPIGAYPTSLSAEHGMAIETMPSVSPGNALGGTNVWDAMYWPGGQIMGHTRWPIGTNV